MTYGICGLSLVPLREVAQFDAPLISEVLYGELFEVISINSKWSNVKLSDGAIGWIDNEQYIKITFISHLSQKLYDIYNKYKKK